MGCLQSCRHPESGACRPAGTLQAPGRHPAGTRGRLPGACRHRQAASRHPGSGAGCLQAPCRNPACIVQTRCSPPRTVTAGPRCVKQMKVSLGGQPNTVLKVVRKEEKILSSSHVTVAHCVCVCLKTPPYCDVRGRRERGRGEHKGACPPSLDKIKFTGPEQFLFFNADAGSPRPSTVSIEGRGPCSHGVKLVLSRLGGQVPFWSPLPRSLLLWTSHHDGVLSDTQCRTVR